MTRPLLITDCDEVLLHMVAHFDAWLQEAHDIDFAFQKGDFGRAMTHRATGDLVDEDRVWPLLVEFFESEMDRQTLADGVIEALGTIGEVADIVILTNIGDEARDARIAQLARHGIHHEVFTNRGGKGRPAQAIVDARQPPQAAFVDDLAVHHESLAEHAPDIHRLHMVAEPRLAPVIPPAPFAHARIDDWAEATPWLIERLKGHVS